MANEYAGMTKEELSEAIGAADLSTLDVIDAQLAEVGWAEEGVLRVSILQRKADLGATLTDEEVARVDAVTAKVNRGKALPPVTASQG